jgi:AcrR family transcriptional regulator
MSYALRMSKSRRDQFSEATRSALLEAATHRFATLGFAKTSLEDVAGDIQATRGAVYHHFSSKKALFEAVFEKLETEYVQQTRSAAARGDNAWQRALLALDTFLESCADPVYGRVVWQEGPLALGWAQWEALEHEFAFGLVVEHLRELMEGGHITQLPLDTTARISFQMLGAAGHALSQASAVDKPRLQDEYRLVIVRMLTGLATSPANVAKAAPVGR